MCIIIKADIESKRINKLKKKEWTDKTMKKKHILRSTILVLFLAGLFTAATIDSYRSRIYTECIFEAGEEIKVEKFLRNTSEEIAFVSDVSKIDNKIPGEYTIKVKSGFFTYKCKAIIQDTIPPKAESVNVFLEEGQEVTPEQFVTNIEDITEVKATYVSQPDYNVFGKQSVQIRLTDAGNNECIVESNLITRVTIKELEMEVGSEFPQISEFLLAESEDVAFVTEPESIDMKKIGNSNIDISVNGAVYTTVLHLKDTTPPVVEGKNCTAYTTDSLSCEDFIASATDVTKLTYAFVTKPNLKKIGEQTVSIVITDEGGNSVQKDMKLTVVEDTEPPVIKGAKDFTAYLGYSISYKSGVTVTDNRDKKVSLKVDKSKVNTKALGTYPVTYTATDAAGNTTSITVNLKIIERTYSQSEVNALADEVLAKIIKSGMSQRQKLTAIYNYVRSSITYTNSSDKSNWLKAAFCGLADKKGDCYTYACTAKALLNRAGIKNKDIKKIPTARSSHYWNLVDIGEGWYHFDTTPRKGQNISFCYISDANLMAYSNSHGKTHNYDRSVYTDIK